MKKTLLGYIVQYSTLITFFFVTFAIERSLGLTTLTLWFLSYIAYRHVSLPFLLVLTLLCDSLFFYSLGSTFLLIGFQGFLFSYMKKRVVSKKVYWLMVASCIAIFYSITNQRASVSFGFLLSSIIYFFPFAYRIRVRELLTHRYV